MKTLRVTSQALKTAGRWDIDFHLPPLGIKQFHSSLLRRVDKVAGIIKTKCDPTLKPDAPFLYVDISSVDVNSGTVERPQELIGEEAPSRARKVIHAYDIIISTCRPTRGAVAVVPEHLHGQICSTGFSVIRALKGVNPFYLHFALRIDSTLEQFRKWSTGSSYPAILDEDVAKTLIPVPEASTQDQIAKRLRTASVERERAIQAANEAWKHTVEGVIDGLSKGLPPANDGRETELIFSIEQIEKRIAALQPVEEESADEQDSILELFPELDEDTE